MDLQGLGIWKQAATSLDLTLYHDEDARRAALQVDLIAKPATHDEAGG